MNCDQSVTVASPHTRRSRQLTEDVARRTGAASVQAETLPWFHAEGGCGADLVADSVAGVGLGERRFFRK